jgi:2-(1,2-epoxy-1,2-dihydrophenyl)acetyl-CoA isomerase
MSDALRREQDGPLLTLTMNRPEVRNALDWRSRDELRQALVEASADLTVRAVLLTGAGDAAFCTGADLRGGQPAADRPAEAPARVHGEIARGVADGWQRLVTAVLDCEKPVIAAVNGVAAGAGMHLALACDLVVMAQSARLVPVFVRRGIAPDAAGAYLLTRLTGVSVAKRLYLMGEDVAADEAHRLGLVSRVVPDTALLDTARSLALRLAAGPTRTLAVTKRLVNTALDASRESALADEARSQESLMTTTDAQEGVRAFQERREPEFRGW